MDNHSGIKWLFTVRYLGYFYIFLRWVHVCKELSISSWSQFLDRIPAMPSIGAYSSAAAGVGLAQRLSQVIWGDPPFHGCSWPQWRSQLTCPGGMSWTCPQFWLEGLYPALCHDGYSPQSLLEKFPVWFHNCTTQQEALGLLGPLLSGAQVMPQV